MYANPVVYLLLECSKFTKNIVLKVFFKFIVAYLYQL